MAFAHLGLGMGNGHAYSLLRLLVYSKNGLNWSKTPLKKTLEKGLHNIAGRLALCEGQL